MKDPFLLECDALPLGVRVVAFEGTETISKPYRYEIYVLADADADVSEAVGAPATLVVHATAEGAGSGADEPLVVRGVIATAAVIEHFDETDVYRVSLVPRVTTVLGQDRHSRVFVSEPVPSIIQTLLREAAFTHDDCEFRLAEAYDPLPFVCQYRESTLDFLSRRMERDGIYYFFGHDGPRERLVVVDDRAQHSEPRGQARYARVSGMAGEMGVVTRFRSEKHVVPGRVHVDDYDYLRPVLPVRGEAVVNGGGAGELRVRGENVTSPKDAQRIARLRAQQLQAQQTVFRAEGFVRVHAGEVLTLREHPRAAFDGNYLVTALRIRGHAFSGDAELKRLLGYDKQPDAVHAMELEAIRADVQFRPALDTPTPRVNSMEGGVIEGDSESDYAQLDLHGRYLVKFRFDERDGRGSRASARVRMMQPHAGNPESFHFPLRKGTEVLVAFEGGDPDRPVIAGAVPNVLSPTLVTDANATRNIIQTGGRNRIQMEDREGKQHVRISTPHLNSFIHLGAPNDGHAKISNTYGNSLSLTAMDVETGVGKSRLTVIGDFFYVPWAGVSGVGNLPSAGAATPSWVTPPSAGVMSALWYGPANPSGPDAYATTQPAANALPGVTALLDEAVGVSSVSTPNTSVSGGQGVVQASSAHRGDLILMPTAMMNDPDGRAGYRLGSDLKYITGDNVTKAAGDNVSSIQGNSASHVWGSVSSVIGSPGGAIGSSHNQYPPSTATAGSPPATPPPGKIHTSIVYGDDYAENFGSKKSMVHGSVEQQIGDDLGRFHSTFIMGSRAVNMVGPMDEYTLEGIKISSVQGVNISGVLGAQVSMLLGPLIDMKYTTGSIELRSGFARCHHDIFAVQSKQKLTNEIMQRVGTLIDQKLGPVISQETTDIKTVLAQIHTVTTELTNKINSIVTHVTYIRMSSVFIFLPG